MSLQKPTVLALATLLAVAGYLCIRTSSAEVNTAQLEQFQVTVRDILDADDLTVKQIRIDCLPNSWVAVLPDKKNAGGVSASSGTAPKQADDSKITVTVFADHVEWKAGGVDALKFALAIDGKSGKAIQSNTGPMDKGKKLRDVVTVPIQSGTYKYGLPIPAVRFQGVTFSLTVTPPASKP